MINKFTEKGYWKNPKMDKWFYGELSFDPETGGKLELTSNEFFPSFRIDENKILIGESSTGDLFTLIDYSQNGFKGSTVHYNIEVIIKGCHIISKKDLLFKTVKFEFLNSRRWYGKSGINYENISDGFKIEYRRPSNIYFKTKEYDGEVGFGISRKGSGTDNDISLKEYAYYMLKYNQARSLHEILNDAMIHTEFITLMTFRQSYPRHIILGGAEGSSEACDRNAIFFRHSFYSRSIKENWSGVGLVDYNHSLFNFENTLGNWSNLYKDNIYLVNCALSIFKNPSSFSEDTFMNVIRSVEAFHRNTNNSPKDILKIRVKGMIDNLCKNDETIELPEFLLNYGITNEEGIEKFTQKITNTRNYHSHLDTKSMRQRFEGTDLYYASNVLLTILLSNVLMKIGLQREVFMHRWTDILGYKQPKNTDLL